MIVIGGAELILDNNGTATADISLASSQLLVLLPGCHDLASDRQRDGFALGDSDVAQMSRAARRDSAVCIPASVGAG